MTWDPNPPHRPPLGGHDPADPADEASRRTLDQSETPSAAAGPPPPANPAWPTAERPTEVSVSPIPPVPPPYAPTPSPRRAADVPPPIPPVPPVSPGWSLGPAPTPAPVSTAGGAPRPRHAFLKVLGALVFAAALVGSGFGIRAVTEDQDSATVVRAPAASTATVPDVTIDPNVEPLAAVAEALSPSVVQIEVSNGLGSGVVYRDGLVLTNAHVVGPDTTVTVRTADGQALEGRVLGTDAGTDIAVVEVPGADLPVVPLADVDPIVGQTAVALGSPFGLEQTVTAGIVSAVNRPVDNDKGVVVNMIQTDASINPGNSGGALVNRNGQLIGINTAIFSQSGENNGIGFAIPVETARKTADKIVNGQSVAKAGLGLSGPPETPTGEAGAFVESLVAGGAAEAGGIRVGDIIVAVDGDDIRSFEQLRGVISSYSPGDAVTVEVVRDGESVTVEVTLGTLGGS